MTPVRAAELANSIQKFLVKNTRLKIPTMIHEECLAGLLAIGGTTFPQAIGLASTWDPDAINRMTGTVIKKQVRSVGSHQGLAPVVDVVRDLRWGRIEETYGEDQYLVARMGAAYISGLQGESLGDGVIATPKHFAAHSFSEGGRNCAPVHVAPREFREVFLFPFEAAVRIAKAWSLMVTYHEIDGIPCAGDRHLLTEILREEWGFKGFIVSDYWAVQLLNTGHKTAPDIKEAGVMAVEAGIDIELPAMSCYRKLAEAVREGLISEGTIDAAVSRVLKAKFLLGLFENPYVKPAAVKRIFSDKRSKSLSLEITRKSIVLLKNAGNTLPLRKNIKSIAVVGPNADALRNMFGDYHYPAHYEKPEEAKMAISVLAGIKRKPGSPVQVHYAKGCGISDPSREGFYEAVNAAENADAVIAVVGEVSGFAPYCVCGEGKDRTDLGLPGVQEELLKTLHATGRPLIAVLINGRPICSKWMTENCSAIVEAWFPAEHGGTAIADVLFGDYNPGGKIPVTFPVSAGQLPYNYNRKYTSRGDYVGMKSEALFPFGHGLSYTEFEYSGLKITPKTTKGTGNVSVSFAVKNKGKVKGDEIVQLYLTDEFASVSRPMLELKGFKRITLKPGERRKVEFTLYPEQLAFLDSNMELVVEPGTFRVSIGSSSQDIRLKSRFRVGAGKKVLPKKEKFFSAVRVC